jgi:hypothetical protein
MTITSPTRQRRPLAARLALVSAASLSLLAGPVAFAGSASAAPYDQGKNDKKVECWVKAKDVKEKADYGNYSRSSRNSADVKFEFKVWCDKKTDVKFEHWIFQKKHGKWVKIEEKNGHIYNVKDKVTKHTKANVKDTDRKGGHEYVLHVVKIKYDDKNGRHSYTVTKTDHASGTVDFGRSYR